MRAKQTARKSTATLSQPGSIRANRTRDPVQRRITRILEAKRKSKTPIISAEAVRAAAAAATPGSNQSSHSPYATPGPGSSRSHSALIHGPIHVFNSQQSQSRPPPPQHQYGVGRGKVIPVASEDRDPPLYEMNQGVKIKAKSKAGERALKDIRKLQNTHDCLIPRAAFHRLVREITQDGTEEPYRFQVAALEALQEAAEAFIVRVMEGSYLCTVHCGRVTLYAKDMQLCMRLQRQFQQSSS